MGKNKETTATAPVDMTAPAVDSARDARRAILKAYAPIAAIITATVATARKRKAPVLTFAPSVASAEVCAVLSRIEALSTVHNNHFSADDCRTAGDTGKALIGKSLADFRAAVLRDGFSAAQISRAAVAVADTLK